MWGEGGKWQMKLQLGRIWKWNLPPGDAMKNVIQLQLVFSQLHPNPPVSETLSEMFEVCSKAYDFLTCGHGCWIMQGNFCIIPIPSWFCLNRTCCLQAICCFCTVLILYAEAASIRFQFSGVWLLRLYCDALADREFYSGSKHFLGSVLQLHSYC